MNFADRLVEGIRKAGSPICAGLDPVLERMPASLINSAIEKHGKSQKAASWCFEEFSRQVLDGLDGLACAVKIQSACFELYGAPGVIAFTNVVKEAKKRGFLVIGDLKRGDIGASARHYAGAYLGEVPIPGGGRRPGMPLDALTINPYFGQEGTEPFLAACAEFERGVFVVVRSSNDSAEVFQERTDAQGIPLYSAVAAEVARWGEGLRGASGYSAVGMVVGATRPQAAYSLRKALPHTFFLVPGLGAQGGHVDELLPFFNSDGLGALVSVSRSLIYAHEHKKGRTVTDAVRETAREYSSQLAGISVRSNRETL
jgi:orotidine-5'-phosphate decarboxylase